MPGSGESPIQNMYDDGSGGSTGPTGATGPSGVTGDATTPTVANNGEQIVTDGSNPIVPVRIQSSWDGAVQQPTAGNDAAADPFSNNIPFVSAQKDYEWANLHAAGRQVDFQYFADVYDPTLGGNELLWGINVVQSTGKRQCRVREVYVGEQGEAFRCRAFHRGPRRMINVFGAASPGQLNFLGGGGADAVGTLAIFTAMASDTRTWLKSIVGGGDFREVFFPIPTTSQPAADRCTVDSSLTGADLNAAWLGTGALIDQVQPAVLLVADDAVYSGLHIHGGERSRFFGDRIFTSAHDNPAVVHWPFERLHLVRPLVRGAVIFDTCLLDDSPRSDWDSAIGFYNCIVIQGFVHFGSSLPLVEDYGKVSANEPCGRPLVYTSPNNQATDDPKIPFNGLNVCIQGALNMGGAELGGPSAQLRFTKGLSLRNRNISVPSSCGIVLNGNSELYMTNNSVMYVEQDINKDCLWAKENSRARITSATFGTGAQRIIMAQAANRHLRVGVGAAISLGTGGGQFLDVLTFNGYFTRRQEVNAAVKCTDDPAVVYDKTFFDATDGTYDPGL